MCRPERPLRQRIRGQPHASGSVTWPFSRNFWPMRHFDTSSVTYGGKSSTCTELDRFLNHVDVGACRSVRESSSLNRRSGTAGHHQAVGACTNSTLMRSDHCSRSTSPARKARRERGVSRRRRARRRAGHPPRASPARRDALNPAARCRSSTSRCNSRSGRRPRRSPAARRAPPRTRGTRHPSEPRRCAPRAQPLRRRACTSNMQLSPVRPVCPWPPARRGPAVSASGPCPACAAPP